MPLAPTTSSAVSIHRPTRSRKRLNVRLGANMVETNANNDGLQTNRRVFRSNGVAFHVFDMAHGRGGQAYSARGQVRQGGVRPQEDAELSSSRGVGGLHALYRRGRVRHR